MTDPRGNTFSTLDEDTERERMVSVPCVYLLLQCDQPFAESTRISLGDVSAIEIGRGSSREVGRELRSGSLVRRLSIDDGWLSSTHARVSKEGRDWVIEDQESKNGTRLNGQTVTRASLAEGDIIGVGHTLLLFASAELPGDAPVVVNASELRSPVPDLVTFDVDFAKDIESLARIALTQVTVMIRGESGTGKELIARALHTASGRDGEFVAVNCGALPETLVESQLFGYRKGAFSGATEDREGLFGAADKGTLFLDEIGDLAPASQAAFLRVLQEREFTRVGGTKPIAADVRVAAATHREIGRLIEQEKFRDDLAARLNGFTIHLPPLRERRVDLGLLVATLLRRVVGKAADNVRFSNAAGQRLVDYHWPRNIRELEKCLETAVALAGDAAIQVEHLGLDLQSQSPPCRRDRTDPDPKRVSLSGDDIERKQQLEALLNQHKGNISQIARVLHTSRTQVQRWVKRFGFDAAAFRG